AVADDKNMLFFNPAGFADYGLKETSVLEAIYDPTLWKPRYTNIGDLTIASVTFGINTQMIEKYGFDNILYQIGLKSSPDTSKPLYQIIDNELYNKFENGTLTAEEAKYFQQMYYNVLHPKINTEIMSYARHYFGFGLFTSSDLVLKLEPSAIVPVKPVAQFYNDFVYAAGIGMHIPGYKKWSAGLTMKYFQRLKIEANNFNDAVTLFEFFSGDYLDFDDISDKFEKKSFLDFLLTGVDYTDAVIDQMKIGTGLGFDLGLMYRYSYAWRFGLQLSDVYTRIRWWDGSESSAIPINARLGAAYKPAVSFLGLFEDPILAVDIEDVFHQQDKNFFLKWHFGSEFKLLFKILTIRLGINEGYPSAGLGIDINFYFLSKLPIIGWLRPDSIYFPKFDPNDKEFLPKNPVCCCLSGLLAPLFYAHIRIDLSYTGYELGQRPGDLQDYQFILKTSLSYSY
ncbi:MAG: hypothetical protein JW827_10280, partial [Spirochaetes bacterium]|nr:hypothetical protein [Spirochaetota bacterium]